MYRAIHIFQSYFSGCLQNQENGTYTPKTFKNTLMKILVLILWHNLGAEPKRLVSAVPTVTVYRVKAGWEISLRQQSPENHSTPSFLTCQKEQ